MGLRFRFASGAQLERIINDGQQFIKINQLLFTYLDNVKLPAADHVPDEVFLHSRFGICLAKLGSRLGRFLACCRSLPA